jgi:DNA-binding LacI/PurR family transcriptional regulator
MAKNGRPTMADVAAEAGVSLSTVSLSYSGAGPISPEMKARVEKAAAALNYGGPSAAGRALRSGRSRVVGVVIHDSLTLAFRAPLILQIMDGLISDLGDMGLGVLLLTSPSGVPEENSLLETAPMDAAVLLRVRDHDEPALEFLRRRGIPNVVMDGEPPAGAGVVTIDDGPATVDLIQRLRDLGHERIGTVTLPIAPRGETTIRTLGDYAESAWAPTQRRLHAFVDAGVEPCVIVGARESLVEEGIAAGHLALTHESRPTALVVQSDQLAAGVLLAARELDLRVPQDVSITGFDGLSLPWLNPVEITTVVQDGEKKGHALAAEVKALLAGETPEPAYTPLEYRAGNTIGRVNPER